jgi:hypothetical protein
LEQQQPDVLTNPFPKGKNMAQDSTFMSAVRGSQGTPVPNSNNSTVKIYMMNVDAHLSTRTRDYEMLESGEKGNKASNPLTPIQIDNIVGEKITWIPKGAFKKDSHNPNVRVSQNYFVVEDVTPTPCAMSALEVL